jgi:Polyketide cyclase / dehydrase and lipid transport
MLDFSCKIDALIQASPQVVFGIVSDMSRHVELAGSGELNTVEQDPPGPVGPGTRLHAGETLMLADGSSLDVTSDSVVVTCDPPTTFSWITSPVLADRFRRVQWWFHLDPDGSATRVVHEVELDIGELHDPLLISLREDFEQVRGSVIRAGMEKTLQNLKRIAEPSS